MKWIEFDSDEEKYDIIKCPYCKHIFTVDSYHWTDIGFIKDDFKFCPNCGAPMQKEKPMADLIERQAVMDTVAKSALDLNDPDENWIMQDRIKEIPSAQPYTEAEIQKMQDLEQAQFDKMYELGKQAAQEDLQPTCNNLATDCISRQAALRLITGYNGVMDKSVAKRLLTQISSAQPEPQWIPCSERLPEAETMYFRPKHRYLCQRKK